MRYFDDMCPIVNETVSSLRPMEEVWEGIMQEKKKHTKFYALGCARQRYMWWPMMHVREQAGHHEGMSFL